MVRRKEDRQEGDEEIPRENLTMAPEGGFIVVKRRQRLWIHDGQTMERFSRKETGRNLVAKSEVAAYYEWFIESDGLDIYYGVPYEDIPNETRWRLRSLYWRSRSWAREGPRDLNGKSDWRDGTLNYANAYGHYARYLEAGLADHKTIDELETDSYSEFFQMIPSDYYQRWALTERLARECEDAIEGQNALESIQAYENLMDLKSVVLNGAICEKEWVEVTKDGNPELDPQTNEPKLELKLYINPATARVRYCSLYESHDDRKAIRHINQWLAVRQLVSSAELHSGRVTSGRDEWYGTAMRNQKAKDLVLTSVRIDPRVYLGEELGGVTAVDPDYRVPPGTEIWMRHMNQLQNFVESIQTLLKLIRYVSSKGMTYKEFKDRYDPDLRNWGDSVIQVWKGKDQYHEDTYYGESGPGRELVALCPESDWAFWIDFPWIVEMDNYYYLTWMRFVNDYLSRSGFPTEVRVNLDNYGQHKDIGKLIWQKQATAAIIIEALELVWEREIRKHTEHIRPVYYKEVIDGLPRELLEDPRLKKFIEDLNWQSDYRIQLKGMFKSHGKTGGIRGMKLGWAEKMLAEGAFTENGLPDEASFEMASNFMVHAWLNDQFDKAIYLARRLTYNKVENVSMFSRHEVANDAIAGGLHPAVVKTVIRTVERGKLFKAGNLLEQQDPLEVKLVEGVFEQAEIANLGKEALEIVRKGQLFTALRKGMKAA